LSHLIAIAFADPERARSARAQLLEMPRRHIAQLEDSVVVVRTDSGHVRLEQTTDQATQGALGGAFWGALVGLVFMHPLVGIGVGMASGALAGDRTDTGIDDDFMRGLGENLPRGSSALFFRVRPAALEQSLAALAPIDGAVLHTSLSEGGERRLRALLAEEAPAHPVASPPWPDPNRSSSLGPDADRVA